MCELGLAAHATITGLPNLRLLPDAPVPAGRTVLLGPPGTTGRRSGAPAGITPFHRSYQPAGAAQQEVKRRTNVVGIFPDDAAVLRLTGAVLIEAHDEW